MFAVAMAAVALGAGASACSSGSSGSDTGGEPRTIAVPGDAATISDAMERAKPGDLVLVGPGTYRESVTISTPDVTLRGTDRNAVIIDGEGVRSQGVLVVADGVRVENLTVHSHAFNGVLISGMHDGEDASAHGVEGYEPLDIDDHPPIQRFAVDHVTAYNNGLYGIYAFDAQHGTITDSYASGSADSGFYVGQCRECDVVLTGNIAEHNAVGFEFANASDSLVVTGNRSSRNRVGLTLVSTYQETLAPQTGAVVAGNLIVDNNDSASPAHAEGGFGIGFGVSGGTENRITANNIAGNAVVGLLFNNTETLRSLGNQVIGNVFSANGVDLADTADTRAPSAGTCVADNELATALPPSLLERPCGATDDTDIVGSPPGALPAVSVPVGVSFLKVPPPPPQPTLASVEGIPGALPLQVRVPDLASVAVPDRMFLGYQSSP